MKLKAGMPIGAEINVSKLKQSGVVTAAPIIRQLNSSVINADLLWPILRFYEIHVLARRGDRKPIFAVSPSSVVSPGEQDECFQEDGEQERWTCPEPWCTSSPLLECLFVRDLSLICVRSKGRICVLVPSNGILCASMRLSAAIHLRLCNASYTPTATRYLRQPGA